MASRKDDFEKVLDAYKVLGLKTGADDGEIKRAYREMSRKTHPDKNPDDPKAGEKFDAVNKAYEALMDASLRTQFAQKLAAREASRVRVQEMDEARQKMRSQLEAREKAAAGSAGAKAPVSGAAATAAAQHAYEERIARLRREGRDLLAEEEYRRQRARLAEADRVARASAAAYGARGSATETGAAAAAPAFNLAATVRLKWGADVNEAAGSELLPAAAESSAAAAAKPAEPGRFGAPGAAQGVRTLSEEQIEGIVRPYGRALAVLSRKHTSACVVMHSVEAARALVAHPPAGFKAAPLVGEGVHGSADTRAGRGVGGLSSGVASVTTTGSKRPRSAVPGLSTGVTAAAARDDSGGSNDEALEGDNDLLGAGGAGAARHAPAPAGVGVPTGARLESFIAAASAARRGHGVGGIDRRDRAGPADAADSAIGDDGVAIPSAAQNAAFDSREADVLARLHALAGVAIG